MEYEVIDSADNEIVKTLGLRFADNRIYQVEEHQKPGRGPYEVKVDVTEEVLDMFLRILEKRRKATYQACMIEQLKK